MRGRAGGVLVVALAVGLASLAPSGAFHGPPNLDWIAPGLRESLSSASPGETLPILVQFDSEASLRAYVARVAERPGFWFQALPALALEATAEEVLDLARAPGVRYVELAESGEFLLPTAVNATRARAVWGAMEGGPILHPGTGVPIDGTGIGIAVVDSGIDATHFDLIGRVVRNLQVVPAARLGAGGNNYYIHSLMTDSFGHGTHVAGIAAGGGDFSFGRVRGAAPGASLFGLTAGEGPVAHAAYAAAAFDWILANHGSQTPPIRVVTNSWMVGTGDFDPNALLAQLTNALVDAGLVVVFAAGNSGGDGSSNQLSKLAQNPKPGVLSVANYDDGDAGTRDGAPWPGSSRGLSTNPATWPDVAAPGVRIESTRARASLLGEPRPDTAWMPSVSVQGGLNVQGGVREVGTPSRIADAYVAFRFGGVTSSEAYVDWVAFANPAVVYNAHRNAFVQGSPSPVDVPDGVELTQMRFYGPVPAGLSGPLRPVSESARAVAAGDALVVRRDITSGPITFQITSPSGATRLLTSTSPCGLDTEALDLAAAFPGQPSDGTWTVTPAAFAGDPPAPGQPLLQGVPTVGVKPGEGSALRAAVELAHYESQGGTSQAAPHVAGVVALMLQAKGGLTPAQVENLVEDTAYKFAACASYAPDPSNPDNLSSFDKGHGLLDAKATVQAALSS